MSMLESLALERLQALVNGALELDPTSRKALAGLSGKTVLIHCTLPLRRLTVAFDATGNVRISLATDEEADVSLKGNPVGLASLFARGSDRTTFAGSGVEVRGDQEILISLARIMEHLDIDWEQALAGIIGDLPARLAGTAVRQAMAFNRQAATRAASGVSEFIREESGLTLSATEAELWSERVSALAKDTDRLSARVRRLQARLNPETP